MLINFLATLPAIPVINRVGRKKLMVVGGFGMTAGLFGLGFGMIQKVNALCLLSIFIFMISFEFSWGPIVWLYNAEIMTDKAVSLATFLLWASNLIITIVSPTIQQSLKPSEAGYIFLGCGTIMLTATIFAIVFMKETIGKLRREIQEMFLS